MADASKTRLKQKEIFTITIEFILFCSSGTIIRQF